jgi:hypothetical protein
MSEQYNYASNEYDTMNLTDSDNIFVQSMNLDQLAHDFLRLNQSSSQQDMNSYHSASGLASSAALSSVEQAILRSQVPIELNDTEEIVVNGQRGLWANKDEVYKYFGNYSY